MSNLILSITDDHGTDSRLRLSLTKTAPDCQLEFVGTREEIAALRRPTVILLDLMLSREPAFDMLRWLRAEQRYRTVPVFVLGSEIIDHEVNEAFLLGANSCLLMTPERETFDPIAQGIATYASLMPTSDC